MRHSLDILDGTDGIGIVRLNTEDVVRHRLVKEIIIAYAKADELRRQRREEEKFKKEEAYQARKEEEKRARTDKKEEE